MNKLLLALALPGVGLFAGAVATEGLPGLDTLIVPGIIILILVLLNGLFVMSEFAIIGVRPTQVEQLADDGNRTAQHVHAVLYSRPRQDSYIATAQLGITIASLGLGMYGEPQVAHFLEPYIGRLLDVEPSVAVVHTAGYFVSLSLLTYVHVVIGEMVPKSLALSQSERAVLAVARPMQFMETVFAVPVRLLNSIGNLLLRVVRVPLAEGHARLFSPEELELIISESAAGGLIAGPEEEIILNIFGFGEHEVHQIMKPRNNVQAVASDMELPDILHLVTDSNFSRFPVYEGDLDHVIGILHVKDLVRQQVRARSSFDIRLIIRPALLVPEKWPVEKLLAAFKRRRQHMAIVLDEYGGTAGIVTLEDLVEEVVGEVRDEFDQEGESMIRISPGVLELSGTFLVSDLRDEVYLGGEEALPEVETVGGLIVTGLGRPPLVGDQYRLGSVSLTVLAVDNLAVSRARVEYPVESADEY